MDTNDIPNVAKHIMEQKLIITGFVGRLTTKTATLEKYIEKIQEITTRIDFHKITAMANLLESEWRELNITWTALEVRRSSPDDMHGLHSIVTRTKAGVVNTLHMSHDLLRAAREIDTCSAKGGPPGGIPRTPGIAIKGPTINKERFNAETNKTTNSKGERTTQRQAKPKGGDTVVWDKQNKTNPETEHQSQARKGTDTRKREMATPAHKTRVAEDGVNRKNKTVDVNEEQRKRGAASRADQRNAQCEELKIKQETRQGCGQIGENKTVEMTGPQAWRAVMALCQAFRRQVNMWIRDANDGIIREEQTVHRTSTEKHLHTGWQDRKKWLCEQLSACQTRMNGIWQEHKRVLSTGGDEIRLEYEEWQEELPYESPILSQLLDLISLARTNLFEPKFKSYDP